jgi:hypothetical protein
VTVWTIYRLASNGRRFVAYTHDRAVAETAASSPRHEVWERAPGDHSSMGLPFQPDAAGVSEVT